MKTRSRKRLHIGLALFFAAQMPFTPFVVHGTFEIYLVWVSQYALVASHWSAAAAETPTSP